MGGFYGHWHIFLLAQKDALNRIEYLVAMVFIDLFAK